MPPAAYTAVLQECLRVADQQWRYSLPDLPRPEDTNKAGLIKSCCLTANSNKQNLALSFVRIPSSRAISARPLSDFLHFTCPDFRLQHEDGKLASFRESADYVARLLKNGIHLNGNRYSFYGHSPSQLKSKSCFLMLGSQEYVDEKVEALGDFTMKTVAKKAKRIGLLFSTAHAVIDVDPARCRDIPDVERESYIFTDGCGNISSAMARLLAQKMPTLFRNREYRPSVFQIRYRGYKGVVVLKPKLEPQIWLEFRKSMKKFSGGQDLSFSVVDFSKPFTYGYLNDEVVLLLHALGIEKAVLEQKQHDHLDLLDHASRDPIPAFRFLNSIGESGLAEKILLEGIESCQNEVRKFVNRERGKMINKRNLQKSRILIPKSRLLFGVCDNRGVLQEGECFVKPTMDDDGIPHALTGSYVLVARNPCLHPGDLQKLRVVARPELAHLVDCIVFPVKGRRPAADMMSGGDLDGDKFFVCWDKDLIPADIAQPAEYPGPREPMQFTKITTADRIDYFARSSSMQLGQIKNLYLKWARLHGPLSSQCQELNRLFSQCVDASRITIPDRLKDAPEPPQDSEFILDALHASAVDRVRGSQEPFQATDLDSADRLMAFLTASAGYTQFELVQMTLRWCQMHCVRFEEFWHLFDLTQLSPEEKPWLIAQLPPYQHIPEAINSDLLQSSLLSPQELSYLGLRGARIRWKLTYASESDRLANLLDVFYRVFPVITRKLLVLRIHDRLSVAIYLPATIQPEDETSLGPCSRLFAIPHSKDGFVDTRVTVPTKHNSRFYYDRGGFQLYEGKRANTFVFLARAANDDSRYRSTRGRGNRARARQETIEEGINQEWRTSIALNKFSQGLAKYVGRLWREGVAAAELYIISNSDQRSFRNLDLWLEQVDTDQIVKNFEVEKAESEILSLHNLDLFDEPATVRKLLKDKKLDSIAGATPQEISRTLDLAWRTNSQDLVNDLFSTCVGCLTASSTYRTEMISVLISFLDFAPAMAIHLIRINSLSELDSLLRQELRDHAYSMLRALILCANKMGHLALSNLDILLAEIQQLSIDNLKSLIELVALTVSYSETALDILVERLEPSVNRIVLLTPRNSQYLVKQLSAIAIDHIEEAASAAKDSQPSSYRWKFDQAVTRSEGSFILFCDYRIDAPMNTRLAVGDHVRFFCVQCPESIFISQVMPFDALVEKLEVGRIALRCLRHPSGIYQQCLWRLEHCGSFVTAQTMMNAVVKLISEKETCCKVYRHLLSNTPAERTNVQPTADLSKLNPSQQMAVIESLQSPITSIWGPPGTGKTHTIVAIINEIIKNDAVKRLLVTAPTHNAVDNVMRRYLKDNPGFTPVRVSTDVHKVSSDLLTYTCDAMLGKDINQNPGARRKAQKKISEARLIFSTCIGAGLGLLRDECFDGVIIDEASQQTEPASLVPIVKGCCQLVLVGDHVQLRATVQPHAAVLGYDVSLFESLWNDNNGIGKVMLDTQYRMHPSVCKFPSDEFYEGNLKSAAHCGNIEIPVSAFAWPKANRMVFVQSSTAEDLGRKSKSNAGQAKLCQAIMSQLRETSEGDDYSIAILTPYTRQARLLKQDLPRETISSIDGFQGQEADVVVYVSVRCNEHGDVGFLKDMRRLNVALTRARAGIIIIGDEKTLTGRHKKQDQDEQPHRSTWRKLITACHMVYDARTPEGQATASLVTVTSSSRPTQATL